MKDSKVKYVHNDEDDKILSIDGGLLDIEGTRYNGGKSPKGKKVRYLNRNGMQGDRESANRILHEGQVLEVKEIYVGRSFSSVEFMEYPGETFNTVMFAEIEEG